MKRLPSSFRDPHGFLFERDGVLLRQVNRSYGPDYDKLSARGGLFDEFIEEGYLVAHQEVDVAPAHPDECHKILRPEKIPFISYPYEWSFSQLKDAALLTLKIQKRALARGFALKDASAFNVQFMGCRPVFIDTLSFESYREGSPWVAYRQFCQHFLAPLSLYAHVDARLAKLSRTSIDGIPLDLASRLLPRRTWLRFGLLSHLHLHARAQRKHASGANAAAPGSTTISRSRLVALLDNLESTVRGLQWKAPPTEWGDYYEDTNYTEDAMRAKLELVAAFAKSSSPELILDLGANTGLFTRRARDAVATATPGSSAPPYAVACDIDELAVERSYLQGREKGETLFLPLVMDLTNPSPAIGWHHRERESLVGRGGPHLVLALALIHHLAISNNVPFDSLAAFFQAISRRLIIEFVPKSDSQVQRLLATREDVFPNYDQESFEAAFGKFFVIDRSEPIPQSDRRLYLMTAK